ncbi:MAG: Gfo/Idh/MocA family oxidoreductase [Candidatus Poribacteria bacterium]|nr:Gfo/Idh/MocA family oxidoreductase [Candidatus Poribacteria bacterium]
MDRVRYGIIGIKGVGAKHIELAQQHEKAELTALADVDASAVKQQSEELGVRGFTDYRDMLDAGVVDAVSIATPHHLHAIIGLACLNAGVHIFTEKPLANRVSEADTMIETAKAKGLKLCVGHQYRTYRTPQTMKHLIETGAIGKIMRVLWTWIEFRAESYYARDIWRGTWRHAGGGVLMNQTSHDLDLICWLIGEPVQVSAMIGNQFHEAEIEDVVCASVLFANGAYGSIQLTINQPRGYSIRQIAGDRGTIMIPDVQSLAADRPDHLLLGTHADALSTLVSRTSGIAAQPETTWKTVELLNEPAGHPVLMDSFIDAILNGGEPLVNGESALPAVELINAIVLSGMQKKTVDLPVDRGEYDQLFEALSRGEIQAPRAKR